MKTVLRLVCLTSVILCSCNSNSQTSKQKEANSFQKYLFVFSVKEKGGAYKIETSGTLAQTDSVAYLEGRIKFARYHTDFTVPKVPLGPEPLAFKVIDMDGQDVFSRLNLRTLNAIDSLVAIEIEQIKSSIYNSSGEFRIADPNQRGLRSTIDSLQKSPNSSQQ
jgi:hypothetical protein